MSTMQGVFILGILSGWIIEWIFVRLFVPNPKKKLAAAQEASRKENANLQKQVADLKAGLEAAKEENAKLQQQLAGASIPVVTLPAESTDEVAESSSEEAVLIANEPEAADETVAAEEEAPVEVVEEPAGADGEADSDLTRLNGIGPKFADSMRQAGIRTYSQLASMSLDELNQRLTGMRYSKVTAETWPEQARLAAAEDWEGLKAYQALLKA